MAQNAMPSPKQQFLDAYEQEHQTTMKVLRAFPAEKAELRPHAKCKTARELAFAFVAERGLGMMVMKDGLANGMPPGGMPSAPARWEDLLPAIEKAHVEFGDLIRSYSEEQLLEPVHFFAGPGKLEKMPRIRILWFLHCDQIHHRGQFSIYLRMADGKVPSIYGPSADEPWM
jgi:uncharacterized damage-inducible protein DinB